MTLLSVPRRWNSAWRGLQVARQVTPAVITDERVATRPVAAGICDLLDLVREPEDPPVDEDLRWDEGGISTDGRVSAIFTLANGGAVKRIGPHEVLAKLFFDRDDVSHDNFAGRVIVGTPLWVATARPMRPIDSLPRWLDRHSLAKGSV
jgi:hypothetical protein